MPDIEPGEVRASALLWLVAVAAGVFETGLVVLFGGHPFTGDIIAGALLRLVVFALVGVFIAYLRRGRDWARWCLAVGLGVFGTLSLVIGPIEWLAAGNSLPAAIEHTTLYSGLFAASRIGHTAAVLGALVLMFRPAANAYFRRTTRSTVERPAARSSSGSAPGTAPRPPAAVRTGRA
jgi:hypothetical protein